MKSRCIFLAMCAVAFAASGEVVLDSGKARAFEAGQSKGWKVKLDPEWAVTHSLTVMEYPRANVAMISRPPDDGKTEADLRAYFEALATVAGDDPSRVWAIGGASVYRQLLPYCTYAYITKFDVTLPADVYFPDLDADPQWHVIEEGANHYTQDGVRYRFRTYCCRQAAAPEASFS